MPSRALSILIGTLCAAILPLGALHSAEPDIKTPSPVIFLADNLDEEDNLGFCIDTVGRGISDRLHLHSCKPRGGDVQFRYNAGTGHIASATFDGKCAEVLGKGSDGDKFGLLDCSEKPSQRFSHNAEDGTFRFKAADGLCLAAGPTSRQAGPFMARDLLLRACASVDDSLKTWVIRE